MLLIDGVRYLETPPKDEDELEQMVIEHALEIFGENSIYLDLKHKIKTKSGIGSIPDGYVIVVGNTPQWHIVEVELSSHPLHDHIVSQIGKFVGAIRNPNTQAEIVSAIYNEILADTILVARIRKIIGSNEIYKYINDCFSVLPTVTIIIEKATQELNDALDAINHPIKKVVEFRTLVRENAGAVHAHLFEPLYTGVPKPIIVAPDNISKSSPVPPLPSRRITLKNLLDTGILKAGQLIYREYYGKRFEGKILSEGLIELNGKKFDSPSGAASSITPNQVDGWSWWNTTDESGQRILLDNLREKYKQSHSL